MTHPAASPGNSEVPENLPQYKADVWGLPAILILGLFMAAVSWQKWADLIVDYGQQLYLPWQISEGKVLYRDLDYLFGPFSAYLHALLFKIFGPGIMVLAWFNLGLVAILSILIYQLFKYFSGPLTATLATLAFLGIFAFGQYSGGGNFNFVCSYVYELAHGVFLSFLILWLFTQTLENPDRFKLTLIGLLTGLVYLTKPEAFLALATALFLGFYFLDRKQALPKNSLLLLIGTFLTGPVLATTYFSFQMPLSEALFYILLPWLHVFGSSISELPMYRWVLGTDYLGANIAKMFSYLMLIAGFCAVLILMNRWLGRFKQKACLVGWGFSLLAIVSIGLWVQLFPLFDLPRCLPLIVLPYCLYLAYGLLKGQQTISNQRLGLLVFSVFSLVLMFKMIFHVQVGHYGFALALPAMLVLIHILTHEIPKRIFAQSNPDNFYRPVAVTMVAVFIALHVQFEYKIYFLKGQPVGKGSDVLLDYHPFLNKRGVIFNAAMDFIEKEIPADSHFAAIPGAITLNFMTRRESSLKYVYLDPGAFQLIGDFQIYEDLQKIRPPYIVLVEQKFSQQGRTHFGKDFGKHILRWIHSNYFLIQQFGAEPFKSEEFGIQIMKRKPPLNS
ncbi:MAG: glycosyltransferase family 39 protein [Nitrospinota bacterium]|nr:glycosyltransferase family 39 protein [Nitrospinota bacterium]